MSKTNNVRATFLSIILIAIISILIVAPNVPNWVPQSQFFNKFKPHLGLDLQGGAYLVYEADFSNVKVTDQTEALNGVKDVIEKRVNPHGVKEPNIQVSGNSRVIVELPGEDNVGSAISKIGEMPILEFKETSTEATTLDQSKEITAQNEQNKKLAEEILARALKGEDFATLAKQYSEDPGSKDNGGIIDFTKQDTLDTAYADVIFNKLQNGQIYNSVVESQFGYHIIKKLDEKGSGIDKEVKSQHILFLKKTADTQDQWVNTQLSGKQLKASNVQFDQTTGAAEVGLEFNDEGKQLFADITRRNIGKPVGIFLDGNLITAPKVNEEIVGGRAVISGSFSLTEAKLLSQRLNAGALPVPIKLISQQVVGPTLGKVSLEKSLYAGLIGFVALAIFVIFYYRFLGLIAILALAIYALITMAIFEAWPVTFTLSGIAGFILSIGMAVDANVLIFERTKEELRAKKALMPSIEEGFRRAWPSIRDSNFSSLITCFILIALGKSMVKGFAVTLTIGILVSMFTAIFVTRNFLALALNEKMSKHLWLFGVKKPKDDSENK